MSSRCGKLERAPSPSVNKCSAYQLAESNSDLFAVGLKSTIG
jgi:hypothetical protein